MAKPEPACDRCSTVSAQKNEELNGPPERGKC